MLGEKGEGAKNLKTDKNNPTLHFITLISQSHEILPLENSSQRTALQTRQKTQASALLNQQPRLLLLMLLLAHQMNFSLPLEARAEPSPGCVAGKPLTRLCLTTGLSVSLLWSFFQQQE